MAKRGPKPTPTKILKLRGSWRADARQNEPDPPEAVPSCPSFLGVEGKREWRRVVSHLRGVGLLTKLDRSGLALYCSAWEEFLEADKLVKATHITLKTANDNYMINPAVNVRSGAWKRAIQAAREFGMTPSARVGLSSGSSDKKQTEGKERFFEAG